MSASLQDLLNRYFSEMQKRRSNVVEPKTGYGGNVNALSGVSNVTIPRKPPTAIQSAMGFRR